MVPYKHINTIDQDEKRVIDIMKYYEKRGVNKENINTIYRNILKLKYEKAQ